MQDVLRKEDLSSLTQHRLSPVSYHRIMFGYIIANKPELKIKDYEIYHSYYCGLCHTLKRRYGRAGQLTLSYDMTFLYILLSGLYEPEETDSERRCVLHPAKKQLQRENPYAVYAADMNVLLSYYDLMDDWQDEHSHKSLAAARILGKRLPELEEAYPRQAAAVKRYVEELGRLESAVCTPDAVDTGAGARSEVLAADPSSLDAAAGLTGTMLGEIFCMKEDEWALTLRRLGFYLGKYIYLMDAWEDRSSDREKGSYNVWLMQGREVDEQEARSVLNLMMSECAFSFEALPVLKNAEIIRNILYSGVWIKYEQVRQKENESKN